MPDNPADNWRKLTTGYATRETFSEGLAAEIVGGTWSGPLQKLAKGLAKDIRFALMDAPKGILRTPFRGGQRVIDQLKALKYLATVPDFRMPQPIAEFLTERKQVHRPKGGDRKKRASVTTELAAAIKTVRMAHGQPGKQLRWERFCDLVREAGGITGQVRGWGDKTIRRRIEQRQNDN